MRLSVADIKSSPEFAECVAELSVQTGRSQRDIEADAKDCLGEMMATVEPRATSAWDRFGRYLTRAYTIDASASNLADIRALGLKHSLVFLPNHRSYLDPLVLRRVLAKQGFPPNFVLGGPTWPCGRHQPWPSGLASSSFVATPETIRSTRR